MRVLCRLETFFKFIVFNLLRLSFLHPSIVCATYRVYHKSALRYFNSCLVRTQCFPLGEGGFERMSVGNLHVLFGKHARSHQDLERVPRPVGISDSVHPAHVHSVRENSQGFSCRHPVRLFFGRRHYLIHFPALVTSPDLMQSDVLCTAPFVAMAQ